jgi:hypothetical protein
LPEFMIHVAIHMISVTLRGGRLESVTCEKCQTRFLYVLGRMGVGTTAISPFFQQRPIQRARSAAQKDLRKRLASEAELVPCPVCHWINQEAIEKCRHARYRRAPWLIGVLLIAVPVVAMIADPFIPAEWGKHGPAPALPTVVAIVACLIAAALVLPVRRQLRQRLDPNRGFPGFPPALLPGTPPALVEQADATTGKRFLQAVHPMPDDQYQLGAWAILRATGWNLPPNCCLCLGADVLWYPSPFGSKRNIEIDIPLCASCARRLNNFWLSAKVTDSCVG